ncbi:hypothetical protein B296_00055098 [Ensete ventricosum]|uniref:Uncharacterized protein n=1 Tax=Ensete ventricosum TaxID=4639 RepID=A0A426XFT9_ENSVE|nr:hypothetical protein B296_00055098 [Ensete ventricosum]
MEHRNFLFGMERIRAKETEVCNKFRKLLGLEGCSGENGASILANASIRLREPVKSEDKAKGKATNNRAMGSTAPWYRRGETSVESSIPCSHEGSALVVKGAKEVENTKANSKYQDWAEGQRSRNFIRPGSAGFSSR